MGRGGCQGGREREPLLTGREGTQEKMKKA